MRIVVGMMQQESNSLAPKPASLESFRSSFLYEGEALVEKQRGTATEIGGMVAAAEAAGIELVPTIGAKAVSSAPVTGEAFEYIAGRLVAGIQAAGPFDAVVLALHGAMIVEGFDDGTGELLRRVRAAIGPDCPLAGTLDFHANVTRQMATAADVLVGYHTYPHVDLYQVGQRAVELAAGAAAGKIKPTMVLRRLPMILPAENAFTSQGPMAELMAHVAEVERKNGVLSASAFQTQPWLNVPDHRCSILVIADGQAALAEEQAGELAAHFWRLRPRFYDFAIVPPREAVQRALAAPGGPVVLSDGADGTGSGSSGDSTAILQALLEAKPPAPAFLSIVDPEAVEKCIQAGVRSTITLTVGGKIDRVHYQPREVTGYVKLISDGTFTFKGPQATGEKHHRGKTVVLSAGQVYMVLSERTSFNWDPEFYRSLGLEPADARLVVVKSPAAYRAAYAGLMVDSILVDAPGASTANIRAIQSELDRVQRPVFPFDDVPDEVALGSATRRS